MHFGVWKQNIKQLLLKQQDYISILTQVRLLNRKPKTKQGTKVSMSNYRTFAFKQFVVVPDTDGI